MNQIITICLLTFLTMTSTYARSESCDTVWNNLTSNTEIKTKFKKLIGVCDQAAKKTLNTMIRQSRTLNYKDARVKMFGKIDNHGGRVCSVYSKDCVQTRSIPNHRVMNAEHTWPKSRGASKSPAVSDLHHIFPANSEVNSIRSSYPFCEVSRTQWTNNMSSLGSTSKMGTCFEPPVEHRGDVARAMFYFSVRYQLSISSAEEAWFKKWHKDDPIDQNEIDRNSEIFKIQGNSNPFIDQPGLVEVIRDF